MMGIFLLSQIPLFIEEFARGGGGGSGGGDGAGGILVLVGLISYTPMHLLGRTLRKKWYKTSGWGISQFITWIIAIIIALTVLVLIPLVHSFYFALYVSIPLSVGAIAGAGAGLYNWFEKVRQSEQVRKALAAAEKNDTSWNEKKLSQYAQGIFFKFQQDWSSFNTESMKRYLSPAYQNHIFLMLHALNGAHRVNKMSNVKIATALITHAADSTDDSKDMFVIGFTASASDQLIDTRTGKSLYVDNGTFTEFWRFVRTGNTWLLDGIDQATASLTQARVDIKDFAAKNGLYYSLDWGWLLLPADGYLFSKGKFGISDINNHVIGFVNNVLTQAYTYQPVAESRGYVKDQYLVMQTNVPKEYGRILVKRKTGIINWPVGGGLTHIKMEWGEFNDMYDVYASDLERVTSFELLNPAFMSILRDLPYEVSIEVVDNVVYIFTAAGTNAAHYASLYSVLLKAHKEMKL